MNIVGLLRARSGNDLPDKHLRMVGDRMLVEVARDNMLDSLPPSAFVYCTSNDDRILELGNMTGIKRPEELAAPGSQDIDHLMHALDWIEERINLTVDTLVVYGGNCVSVEPEQVRDALSMLHDWSPRPTAVVPVCNSAAHHPWRAKAIDDAGWLVPAVTCCKGPISTSRQDLAPVYELCHSFWVLDVATSLRGEPGHPPWTFMGARVMPLYVDGCCDVHDEEDLQRAAWWVGKGRA